MGIKDPRAEPESLPPREDDAEARRSSAPPKEEAARRPSVPPPKPTSEAPKARVVTSTDPRLESIEPLINRGDWAGIVRELGPPDKAGALPPHLGLIFALAMNETAGAESPTDAAQLAIRCAAGLFGVAPDSATALVMAKRLLRKNPLSFGKRPAPPARTSALIVFITLVVGAGVGWLVTGGGSLRFFFR